MPGAESLAMDQALAAARRQAAARRNSGRTPGWLDADFAGIYLTHALRASPCESVWRDEDHLMMQGPSFAVRDCYRRHGQGRSPTAGTLPDDHLAQRTEPSSPTCWPKAMAARPVAFIDEHLMQWLPRFAGRVTERASTRFYAALAGLTLEDMQQPAADAGRPGRQRVHDEWSQRAGGQALLVLAGCRHRAAPRPFLSPLFCRHFLSVLSCPALAGRKPRC
jgi:TorA maturation chaperone TorD